VSNVYTAWSKNDWHLDLVHDLPSQSLQGDPSLAEVGLGHISEIFEGNAPHCPCGCIAQAWRVAEIFRVYIEEVRGLRPSLNLKTQAFIRAGQRRAEDFGSAGRNEEDRSPAAAGRPG
jgi:hypothetical protein